MNWPFGPVESQRRFVPRFCTHRDCPAHRREPALTFRFTYEGCYMRADGRRVPRYLCGTCKRGLSKQTFSVTYYLKRPELLGPIAAGLQAGSAHRQIARSLGCAPSTVTRLSQRLGRHALLFQVEALEQLGDLAEPIVGDHFEAFARTQDYPFGVATLVGARSYFIYSLDPAPHARTGRVSPAQRARLRARPKQETRGGYAASLARALRALTPVLSDRVPIRLVTDAHKDYPRGVKMSGLGDRIRHEVHANPERGPKGSARPPETIRRDAAMFPNDVLHALVRHSHAHHRRETIAFGRRLNALMERFFLAQAWRNFMKRVSERRPEEPTPAMILGLTKEPWTWDRVFARRLFPDRLRVPACWREIYRREWKTPGGPNKRHELRLAF